MSRNLRSVALHIESLEDRELLSISPIQVTSEDGFRRIPEDAPTTHLQRESFSSVHTGIELSAGPTRELLSQESYPQASHIGSLEDRDLALLSLMHAVSEDGVRTPPEDTPATNLQEESSSGISTELPASQTLEQRYRDVLHAQEQELIRQLEAVQAQAETQKQTVVDSLRLQEEQARASFEQQQQQLQAEHQQRLQEIEAERQRNLTNAQRTADAATEQAQIHQHQTISTAHSQYHRELNLAHSRQNHSIASHHANAHSKIQAEQARMNQSIRSAEAQREHDIRNARGWGDRAINALPRWARGLASYLRPILNQVEQWVNQARDAANRAINNARNWFQTAQRNILATRDRLVEQARTAFQNAQRNLLNTRDRLIQNAVEAFHQTRINVQRELESARRTVETTFQSNKTQAENATRAATQQIERVYTNTLQEIEQYRQEQLPILQSQIEQAATQTRSELEDKLRATREKLSRRPSWMEAWVTVEQPKLVDLFNEVQEQISTLANSEQSSPQFTFRGASFEGVLQKVGNMDLLVVSTNWADRDNYSFVVGYGVYAGIGMNDGKPTFILGVGLAGIAVLKLEFADPLTRQGDKSTQDSEARRKPIQSMTLDMGWKNAGVNGSVRYESEEGETTIAVGREGNTININPVGWGGSVTLGIDAETGRPIITEVTTSVSVGVGPVNGQVEGGTTFPANNETQESQADFAE